MAPGRRRRGNIDKQASTSGVCRGKLTIMAAALASSSTIGKKQESVWGLFLIVTWNLVLQIQQLRLRTLLTKDHECWIPRLIQFAERKKPNRRKKNVTVSTVEPLYTAWAQHRSYIREWALMTSSCLFLTLQKLRNKLTTHQINSGRLSSKEAESQMSLCFLRSVSQKKKNAFENVNQGYEKMWFQFYPSQIFIC